MSKSHGKKIVNSVNGDVSSDDRKSPSRSTKRQTHHHQHHAGQDFDVGIKSKKSDKSDRDKGEVIVDKNKKQIVNKQLNEIHESSSTTSVYLRPTRPCAARRCISDTVSVKSESNNISGSHSEVDSSHISKRSPGSRPSRFNLTPVVGSSIPYKLSGGTRTVLPSKILEQGKLEKELRGGDHVDSNVPVRVIKKSHNTHSDKSPRRKCDQPQTKKNMQGNKGESPQSPAESSKPKDITMAVKAEEPLPVTEETVMEKPLDTQTSESSIQNGCIDGHNTEPSVINNDVKNVQDTSNINHSDTDPGVQTKPLDEKAKTPERKPSVTFASSVKADEAHHDGDKSKTDEDTKSSRMSPNHRFMKLDEEVGRGSFKTVHKGLEIDTGVHVAWCELQVLLLYD